jgi:uncharacterized protein YndB with AHSA1/START domain
MSATASAAAAVNLDDEATIEIAAPPAAVWPLVADVSNMPHWSPETYRTRWEGDAVGPSRGARFRGWNRSGWVRWSTLCEVEVCEPPHEFTFSTRFGRRAGTRWSYRFDDDGNGGTRVTESRTSLHRPAYARVAYATVLRGHEASFAGGMVETLQRLKRAVEATA